VTDLTLPIGTYDPIVKRSVSLQIIFEGSLDAGLATSCIIIRIAMYAMRRPVMSLAIWVANLTYRARINGHMLVMFRLIAINRHRRSERTSRPFHSVGLQRVNKVTVQTPEFGAAIFCHDGFHSFLQCEHRVVSIVDLPLIPSIGPWNKSSITEFKSGI